MICIEMYRYITCSEYETKIIISRINVIAIKIVHIKQSLGSVVVSVMDSHTCNRGSNPGQGNHMYVMI